MEKDYEDRDFNGLRLRTTMYPVEYALAMEVKIGSLLGGLAGRGAGAVNSITDIDGDALGTAIERFFANIESLGGARFYADVLAHTEVIATNAGGELVRERVDLNRHFRGKLVALKQAVFWVLKVNFAEYFSDAYGPLGGLLERVKARLGSVFQQQPESGLTTSSKTSPPTSISASGESSNRGTPA